MVDIKLLNNFFHNLDELSYNANIGIIDFTTWKQKTPVAKCYPMMIETGTSDSKSNTHLSDLTNKWSMKRNFKIS